MHRAVKGAGVKALPSQSLIETASSAKSLCAPNALIVLTLSALAFVAACQGTPLGEQDQLPGTEMKDLPRSRSS
jgi:hypothetical protein